MNERLKALEKYNLWDGKRLSLGLQRTFYTNKINQFVGNQLVKVLVGQRRSGKSYLLRQTMAGLATSGVPVENILYINKEYLEFDFIDRYQDLEELFQLYKATFRPQGKIYLFIDEIQNIQGWEHFVNSHSQDFIDVCEIFISGSNSRMLSSELATLLSGRYVEFLILPYSYDEYLQSKGVERGRISYLDYLQFGGLPELYSLPTKESCSQYVSSVKDTIILRDIIQRKQNNPDEQAVRDAKLLDDIFVFLVSNASNPVSIPNILKFFKSKNRKVSYETAANYVRYLEEPYLVHPARQYNIRGKEVAESAYKYYLNDLSFKNYLYPGIGYGTGYLLENAVYLELLRNGYKVYVGNIKSKEVDFVAIKSDRTVYIQSSYSIEDPQTAEREYASLLDISDNYEKYVVTLDDVKHPSREGILHIQACNLAETIK